MALRPPPTKAGPQSTAASRRARGALRTVQAEQAAQGSLGGPGAKGPEQVGHNNLSGCGAESLLLLAERCLQYEAAASRAGVARAGAIAYGAARD